MKTKNALFASIMVCLFCLSSSCFAQKTQEEMFADAQRLASKQEYNQAILVLNSLITIAPQNKDYTFYLARLHFWNNNAMLAKEMVQSALKEAPLNSEILQFWIQLEMHANNFSQALELSCKGEKEFAIDQKAYLVLQAKNLFLLKKYSEALLALKKVSLNDKNFKELESLKTSILQSKVNRIAIGYLNTSSSNPGSFPLHFSTIELQHNTSQNAIVGRLSHGNFLNKIGWQLEADMYPKIGKKSYFYLNAGYSNSSTIFPKMRFGAEFYHEEKRVSSSIGSRFLDFDTEKVILFTGHLGINWGELFVSYRPFVTNKNQDWFFTHILNLKKSIADKESFIQLDLQYGTMPYFFYFSEDFKRVNAYRIGLNYKRRLLDHWFVQPIFMYEYEEYFPDRFRNKFNLQLMLSKRF